MSGNALVSEQETAEQTRRVYDNFILPERGGCGASIKRDTTWRVSPTISRTRPTYGYKRVQMISQSMVNDQTARELFQRGRQAETSRQI